MYCKELPGQCLTASTAPMNFRFTAEQPIFCPINTVMQLYIVLPVILMAVKKKKEKEKKGEEVNIVENVFRALGSGRLVFGWQVAALSACLPHIALLLQGLMLADYNSVASHFRFI